MQRRVYVALNEMIRQGRIKPGEVLLEVQVAKAFGISRSPARFALQALCADKVLREASGRGFLVAGRGKVVVEGKAASLENLQIASAPQWARMYEELERELFIRMLFGTVRITEERLAEHFGVSRTVVREVLGRMHSVGLVLKDRLGHWIAERVTPERIKHLFDLRALLEPEAMRLGAPFIAPETIANMRDRMHRAIDHFPAEMEVIDRAETDLHIDLLSHCPNQEITFALRRTHLLFAPTRYLSDPYLSMPKEQLGQAFQEHVKVIDQLYKGDVDKAVLSLEQHLRRASGRWKKRFDMAATMPRLELPAYLTAIPSPA